MAELDPALADAIQIDGRPRFYPPGQHPATARLRKQLELLEAFPSTEEVREAEQYIRDELAMFEEGEAIAKADYLHRHRRRPEEPDARDLRLSAHTAAARRACGATALPMTTPARRDYGRWLPWMGYTLKAVLLFTSIALLSSGHPLAGIAVGVWLITGTIIFR